MDWSSLPEHIVIQIMSKLLQLTDRYHASLTCKAWNNCFHSSCLWHTVVFKFLSERNQALLGSLNEYGHFFKHLTVVLDQSEEHNRQNSIKLLKYLSLLPNRRLTTLTIIFTSKNPLFYAGTEFVQALRELFDTSLLKDAEESPAQLTQISLEHLDVAYDDTVFDYLSENNPKLQMLNIQNHVLVCKVTCDCMLRLVQRCHYLQELHLFYSCLSDKVLFAFAESNRPPTMKRLSLKCRIEDKYHSDLSPEAWSAFRQAHPQLEVKLVFDHTCPKDRVLEIMQPEIPVAHLHLDTFTMLNDEVIQTAKYYSDTLQSLVLRTVSSNSLHEPLVYMATHCKKLGKLYVYCVLEPWVIEKLFELCPKLKETGNYILKDKKEPEPWVVGIEDDYW
ncbi:F-box/LRR-repeat protein 8 [Octopus bimaculoides]|uniref:F-box/LRR-repeat protein 8 n=1 Tax=Octopus bimaculoides TaxID=37653 RepID=A0A0L8ICZ1_OCTBM|nr:F-box/LRR-repeat protein 8 [Octopus bimaculoides]|eukprot:XP_014776122.1 PREDICTED: F-box/LRR-repeat protein 8-like [Octopus bimaculoides]